MNDHEEDHGRSQLRVIERGIASLDKAVAVLTAEARSTKENVERRMDEFSKQLGELTSKFAARDDVENLKKEVKDLKSGINWAIKTVLFVVIVAVLSLVITKAGIPHA